MPSDFDFGHISIAAHSKHGFYDFLDVVLIIVSTVFKGDT